MVLALSGKSEPAGVGCVESAMTHRSLRGPGASSRTGRTLRLSVESVHAGLNPLLHPHGHGLGRQLDGVLDDRPFDGPEPPQHVIDRVVLPRRIHADAQARVLGRAEVVLDV